MANFYVSSGTSFSATINITYPAGSTCTVTNYKKTWTAPNTSGSWTFKANEIGHYTVKAVSGSKGNEEEVLITAEGQVATVTLTFEMILFDGGDNTSVTGGWAYTITNVGYNDTSVRGDNLTVGTTLYWLPGRGWNGGGTDQANRDGYAHTKKKIDVTKYNTITAVSEYAGGQLTVGNASVALKVGTVSLDISALTGSYEVRLGDTISGDHCSKVEISKLYLSNEMRV